MYKEHLALDNLQWLIYHKTQPNHIYIYTYILKLYTRTATKITVLLPRKSSSDDDTGFRHGFEAEAYVEKMFWHKITYNSWYVINPTKPKPINLIYMYKEYLALNNLHWLICHKIQPNQTK